jgi:hypothetical protein
MKWRRAEEQPVRRLDGSMPASFDVREIEQSFARAGANSLFAAAVSSATHTLRQHSMI